MLFIIINARALQGGALMEELREGRLIIKGFKELFSYCLIMD
jgi:hypothetical protein